MKSTGDNFRFPQTGGKNKRICGEYGRTHRGDAYMRPPDHKRR